MLNEVQAAFGKREEGQFRSAQVTGRVTPEQAIELITELVEKARDLEDPSVDPIVITAFMHPHFSGRSGELSSTAKPRRVASACRTSTVSATGMSSRYSLAVLEGLEHVLDRVRVADHVPRRDVCQRVADVVRELRMGADRVRVDDASWSRPRTRSASAAA